MVSVIPFTTPSFELVFAAQFLSLVEASKHEQTI